MRRARGAAILLLLLFSLCGCMTWEEFARGGADPKKEIDYSQQILPADGASATTAATPVCVDSDGGFRPEKRGEARRENARSGIIFQQDNCDSPMTLQETVCLSDGTLSSTDVDCPNGCADGACLPSKVTSSSGPVPEPVAPIRSGDCTESDGGKNFMVKGTTSSRGPPMDDTCTGSGTLIEIFCADGSAATQTYACPYGCMDGACRTAAASSSTCVDGDKSADYSSLPADERKLLMDGVEEELLRHDDFFLQSNVRVLAGEGAPVQYADLCGVNNNLIERYCSNGTLRSITVVCPHGCRSTVCLRS